MSTASIRIRSVQQVPGEEEQELLLETQGQLLKKNNTRYFMYEEVAEDGGKTQNRLVIRDGQVQLRKTGQVGWEMCFEERVKNSGQYRTPYGVLPVTVDTTGLEFKELPGQLRIRISYQLEIQEQYRTDCRMEILLTEA